MDTLPPEVLRIVCSHLVNFRDAANVRFLSHSLSIIAAEFLITRVRFHTSNASLERLENISRHPVFCQTVQHLEYEAALLADVKCRHEYAKHFELDHHGLERPREPPMGCSDRERRLHTRNKSKWTRDIYAKYDIYRSLFDAQKSILENNMLERTLAQCIPRFPKLTSIDVDPIRRCFHMTSKRFIKEFGSDCASPLSGNFSRMSDQLRYMLLPNDAIINSLRKIDINSLSPSFFEESHAHILNSAFSRLNEINIVLRLTEKDLTPGENYNDCFRRHAANGIFKNALSGAKALKILSIGIESSIFYFASISDLLPNATWPQLDYISLSTVAGTQNEFIELLKRQPKLRTLNVALMQLTHGTWVDTLQEMRDNLNLTRFLPAGFLEDPQESWPMDLINVSTYIECHKELDLATAIDMWVTDCFDLIYDDPSNPLVDAFDYYEEADMVREMYGALSDLEDDMSTDELSLSDMSLVSDPDASMLDLALIE